MSSNVPFIHLRTHSAYSLSEGAIRMPELIALGEKHQQPALALTDRNNLFGALEFSKAATKVGIQPIIGCEMAYAHREDDKEQTAKIVLLAKNEAGYQNLLKLTSIAFVKKEDHLDPLITWEHLQAHAEGIILLTGGTDGPLGQMIQRNSLPIAKATLADWLEVFTGNIYMELHRHNRNQDKLTEPHFLEMAYAHNIPLVATNNCLFPTRDLFEAQDTLMCIASGRYLTETDRPQYTEEHYFKSPNEMVRLFSDIPEAIQNTVHIAKRCAAMSHAHDPMLPRFETEAGRSEIDEFKHVSREGLKDRLELSVYPRIMLEQDKESLTDDEKESIKKPYDERLEFELGIIEKMDFPGYFLIVSDFIRWSKDNDIPVGPGRGSGAGSLVAWSMKITDLDPLHFGLLFERFLNPERVSMPDFDIDFCQYRRDEVISYVQQKYGDEKVAQIITFGKLQARAVVRDVGRVLQMPYGQVDRICKMIPNNPANPLTLQEAIDLDPELQKTKDTDEEVGKLLDLGLKLEGMYRHAGTHAAGVVIGAKQLDELVPLYKDPRSDIPATQFSMKYAEMAGLVKFDFLGLKTLTVIQKAVELVNAGRELRGETEEEPLNIDFIPLQDKPTFEMLAKGDSGGVFQMESAGMRDALRKMRPDTLEDIIALISLYRPGPMENIPTYIARKHGREAPDYLHPNLEPCLKETYGVIIYQEQVMEIAKVLGGYSLGEADLLRRAMGKKIKEEMDHQRARFMEGAKKNDVDPKQAGSIFDLVAKFAGYGFNKSHAAAYALIGYQTAYLKANHPVEFITACMNIDNGDTDKLYLFYQEAIQSNIIVLPPDVNASDSLFTVEPLSEDKQKEGKRKRAIRYGLGAIKGVGEAAMIELERQREKAGGSFSDIHTLAEKCDANVMNKRQLENLAKAGAFDSIHPNRRQLVESATLLTRYNQAVQEEAKSDQNNLFGESEWKENTRIKLPDIPDWQSDERLVEERNAVGFYLTAHPLDDFMNELHKLGVIPANDIMRRTPSGGGVIQLAGVPIALNIRASARGRFAYLHISDPTGRAEISVFDDILLDTHREMLEGNQPLMISCEARKDEGGVRLQLQSLRPLEDVIAFNAGSTHVKVSTEEAVSQLNQQLATLKPGRQPVILHVDTEEKLEFIIQLKNRYQLLPRHTDQIAKIEGLRVLETT